MLSLLMLLDLRTHKYTRQLRIIHHHLVAHRITVLIAQSNQIAFVQVGHRVQLNSFVRVCHVVRRSVSYKRFAKLGQTFVNSLAFAVRTLVAVVNSSISVRFDFLIIVNVDVRFD